MAALREAVDRTKRQRSSGGKTTSGSVKREKSKRTTKKPARKAS